MLGLIKAKFQSKKNFKSSGNYRSGWNSLETHWRLRNRDLSNSQNDLLNEKKNKVPLFDLLINETGSPLDIEILGEGFFAFQMADQTLVYSRRGCLRRDIHGQIQDRFGNSLFPEIVIPKKAHSLEVSARGLVRILFHEKGSPHDVGQIETSYFTNPAGLKSVGRGMFASSAQSGEPQQGRPGTDQRALLAQGFLEVSKIDIQKEALNLLG